MSARVIAVDFRARAKPAVTRDTPAVICELAGTAYGRENAAYDLYVRASKLDEDPATYDEAQKLYERAIALDPKLAIAYTNLANIHFRRGSEAEAVELYEIALKIDPRQPEALYNLGYVQLERGDARGAVVFFNSALEADPRFADAHFNMGMALEELGEHARAIPHWKAYLSLEATGAWADQAREYLGAQREAPKAKRTPRTKHDRLYGVIAQPQRALNCLESMTEWLSKQNRPVDT